MAGNKAVCTKRVGSKDIAAGIQLANWGSSSVQEIRPRARIVLLPGTQTTGQIAVGKCCAVAR